MEKQISEVVIKYTKLIDGKIANKMGFELVNSTFEEFFSSVERKEELYNLLVNRIKMEDGLTLGEIVDNKRTLSYDILKKDLGAFLKSVLEPGLEDRSGNHMQTLGFLRKFQHELIDDFLWVMLILTEYISIEKNMVLCKLVEKFYSTLTEKLDNEFNGDVKNFKREIEVIVLEDFKMKEEEEKRKNLIS